MTEEEEIEEMERMFHEAMSERICATSKYCLMQARRALRRTEDMENARAWSDSQNSSRGWVSTALKADAQAETAKIVELERKLEEKAKRSAKLQAVK